VIPLKEKKTLPKHTDMGSMDTCGCLHGYILRMRIVFFFVTGEYNPFFIKKSELQVNYERTLIAQITIIVSNLEYT
jgi:hypothetical protein